MVKLRPKFVYRLTRRKWINFYEEYILYNVTRGQYDVLFLGHETQFSIFRIKSKKLRFLDSWKYKIQKILASVLIAGNFN